MLFTWGNSERVRGGSPPNRVSYRDGLGGKARERIIEHQVHRPVGRRGIGETAAICDPPSVLRRCVLGRYFRGGKLNIRRLDVRLQAVLVAVVSSDTHNNCEDDYDDYDTRHA